jgi:hypothetical protein
MFLKRLRKTAIVIVGCVGIRLRDLLVQMNMSLCCSVIRLINCTYVTLIGYSIDQLHCRYFDRLIV